MSSADENVRTLEDFGVGQTFTTKSVTVNKSD